MLFIEFGTALESCRKGLTNANTKKGNQHMIKALIIMPNVVDAFRSFANWKRSFLVCEAELLVLFTCDHGKQTEMGKTIISYIIEILRQSGK